MCRKVREKDRQLKSRQEKLQQATQGQTPPRPRPGGSCLDTRPQLRGRGCGAGQLLLILCSDSRGEYRRNRTALRPLPHGEDRKAFHHLEPASPDSQQDAAPHKRPAPEIDEIVQPVGRSNRAHACVDVTRSLYI